jgi:hypothetical protein
MVNGDNADAQAHRIENGPSSPLYRTLKGFLFCRNQSRFTGAIRPAVFPDLAVMALVRSSNSLVRRIVS